MRRPTITELARSTERCFFYGSSDAVVGVFQVVRAPLPNHLHTRHDGGNFPEQDDNTARNKRDR